MKSKGEITKISFLNKGNILAVKIWETLTINQQAILKKAWRVMTYKWRWQIALNIPYLMIFILDRNIQSVHKFDMAILAAITTKLHISSIINSFLGIN